MSNLLKQKLHGKTIKFFGPPGTGKTHRLLRRVERFLKRGMSPDEICYISFTNKAVNEVLSLPMHTELSNEQIDYISDKIIKFFN